ncbi:DNA recombination protein RmuC [Legionella sp. 16cNR16C]|uniref:DNA recombination protein RmuC n=1 Tax=Legionella sp. 16cNR16C TaxID=2905656 RepID=UPI001E574BFA|nr:DNA recombination protein RmuC [Legionella sp. 16cNR16C]MCE3046161.1 DNA recombination protein RmuC [Legionella sp. 16cNR16C]
MPDLSYLFSLQGLVYTNLLQLLFLFLLIAQRRKLQRSASLEITELRELFIEQIHQLEMVISENASNSQQRLYELIIQNQLSGQELITKNIQQQMTDIREQINFSFKQHANGLTSHLHSLTEEIRNHLQQLTQQVNHKLAEGFEKTSSTFTDVVRRLTIIDEAQKKITELSTHVVSLQDVLQDKRSRGAFGEVQLNALIANMLPSTHYQMQYTLSNQKRADCILFLPEPTGQVVIDAKFPLETYQKLINSNCSLTDKKILQQQFRQDVSKHIKDIAEKYIIAGETSDGAMMFIPAEAIFAEIHANYPEVVALSQRLKVWLVSPSTLMAVLTTAKAVLKDDATRKQVHIIQKHLHALADDFQRFEKRMDKLSKHIDQAHQDVDEVSTSARKITQRFQRIESVDLLISEESTE